MKQKSVFLRISKYMLKHKLLYSVLLLITAFSIVLDLTMAWFLSRITEEAVRLNVDAFTGLAWFGVVFLVIAGFNTFFSVYLKTSVSAKIRNQLRLDLMNHTLVLPQSYFDNNHSGDLLSRFTNDNQSVGEACGQVIIDLVRNPLLALASFIYLLYLNWLLALICIAVGPMLYIVGKLFGKAMRQNSVKVQEKMSQTTSFLNDILNSSMVFKAFSIERRLMQQYRSYSDSINAGEIKQGRIGGGTAAVSSVLGNLTFLLALIIAGLFVANGALEVGGMMAFIQLMNYLVIPFSELPGLVASMQQSMGAAQRIFEVLDEETELESLPKPLIQQPEFQQLSLSAVSFGYPGGGKLSLQRVSLELQQGKQMAVVGPSGGGKSTLFKLLLGFYRPDVGEILINGNAIESMTMEQLRSYFSYVPQESGLYTGSILENIRNGKQDASEEEVMKALRQANAYDFVMELPEGVNSDVGEHGSWLSGGQRQRLSIARAILKNTPILLLDEATAALDNESEKLVQQAIRKLMKDKTTIVIAHRLSTIQSADVILVMENGRIVECGNHEELLVAEGRYYNLYNSQTKQEEVLNEVLVKEDEVASGNKQTKKEFSTIQM